jgi:acyl dehydratase
MSSEAWPQPLSDVTGPHPEEKIRGVAASMGDHGALIGKLMASGTLPPELMTGLTLFLLARQPRKPQPEGATKRKGAPGVSGRVWARERNTIHRPLQIGDAFVVKGSSAGRHVKRGRRYGTTQSATWDAAGRPVGTNITTGLLSYRPDASLEDEIIGLDPDRIPSPAPDWGTAKNNPHLDALATAEVGEVLGNVPLTVTLAMMAARDTSDPTNPIHSDPDAARAAGLAKPIAGGDHVQSFALELVMARFGPEVLLHGACLDTRWKAPTEAEASITPRATVTEVAPDRVALSLEVQLTDGPVAMVGSLVIPRPA